MNLEYLKIPISIFVPLAVLAYTIWNANRTKRKETNREREALVKFLLNLFIELEKNMDSYPQHLQKVSEEILLKYSGTILITIDSYSGGIINRLSKIDSKTLHIALLHEFKSNSDIYNQIYLEIDFCDDFYRRLLETIKSYQKSSYELKHEFRNGLNEFYTFNANLLSNLDSKSSNKEYVTFAKDITTKSFSFQSDDLLIYYVEYLKPLSNYVIENNRTEYFANELIQKVNRLKVILDDLKGNSEMYSRAFKRNSIELETSLTEVNKIITVLKEMK